MVIIPDFTFTVNQITWTTGINSFTTTATEEAQIRSASTMSSLAMAPTMLVTAPTTPATALTTPTTR
jgi:hypothetical protein